MVQINGAYGEGGGQILRTSLSLSSITGEALDIQNIRTNRSRPGLRPQHLAAVNAVAKIIRADVRGAALNSTRVQLSPGKPYAGTYHFDISTAGSLTLVLQTVFLPLSFANKPSEVYLTGGTHVPWSPIWQYLAMCWLPFMETIGFSAKLELARSGFYPSGGGKAFVKILPAQSLQPLNWNKRGKLIRIRGFSGVANLDLSIAKRQKHQALRRLYAICPDSKIQTVQMESFSKGTFILLKAEFSDCGRACYSSLGAPGKPAEKVADEAVDALFSFLKTDASVDHFLADQILLPLAIIPGESSFRTSRVTQHLLTNAHVIQQFLPAKIVVNGDIGDPALVTIHGVPVNSA